MELSSIAHQLDEEERMRMAEGGVTSEDYRTFLQVPILNSPNCDRGCVSECMSVCLYCFVFNAGIV